MTLHGHFLAPIFKTKIFIVKPCFTNPSHIKVWKHNKINLALSYRKLQEKNWKSLIGGNNFCNSHIFFKIKVVRFLHTLQLICISRWNRISTTGLGWLGWLRCTVCWQHFFTGKVFFFLLAPLLPDFIQNCFQDCFFTTSTLRKKTSVETSFATDLSIWIASALFL